MDIVKDLLAIGFVALARSRANCLAEPERTEVLDYILWQCINAGDYFNADKTVQLLGEKLSLEALQIIASKGVVQYQFN